MALTKEDVVSLLPTCWNTVWHPFVIAAEGRLHLNLT